VGINFQPINDVIGLKERNIQAGKIERKKQKKLMKLSDWRSKPIILSRNEF